MPRNIEIKARIDSVEALLPRAQAVAGGVAQILQQDDSFFRVAHGRLKLREFADGSAELIHYLRADTGEAKASDYVRVPVPDPAALREALLRGCGLLGRVRKTRWLLLVQREGHSARIHIDRVQGLGDFMELEVLMGEGEGEGEAQGDSDAAGAQIAEHLMQQLGLSQAQRLAGAYLDLLQPATGPRLDPA